MTPLKDPVLRVLDHRIDGRDVVVGLEISSERPVLTIRLKGYRTGWKIDLRAIADFAVLHPRVSGHDFELKPTYDEAVAKQWREQYEKRGKKGSKTDDAAAE